jgi:hypothetical protein
MQASSFSTAHPATIRAEINRGIAAARAQQAVRRVEAAVMDTPRRTASRFRAGRLAEYRMEYEDCRWALLGFGVAIGASVMLIAVAVIF